MKLAKYFVSNLSAVGLLVVAALCLFSAGCEKEVVKNDYFPLRDGNRWEYRLLDRPLLKRLADGQEVVTAALNADLTGELDDAMEAQAGPEEPEGKDGKAPAAAQGRVNAKGKVQARRVALELRASVDDLTFRAVYDTAEQVWSKRNGYVGFQSVRGRSYLLILPPHTGYKWVVTDGTGEDLYYEIENVTTKVETPAGTFQNCVVARQESRDRKEVFKYWFAPDVGLVRRSKFYLDEEVFRQELVEYKVKPATPATRQAEEKEVRKAVEGKNRGQEFRQKKKEDRTARHEEPQELEEKVQKHSQPR